MYKKWAFFVGAKHIKKSQIFSKLLNMLLKKFKRTSSNFSLTHLILTDASCPCDPKCSPWCARDSPRGKTIPACKTQPVEPLVRHDCSWTLGLATVQRGNECRPLHGWSKTRGATGPAQLSRVRPHAIAQLLGHMNVAGPATAFVPTARPVLRAPRPLWWRPRARCSLSPRAATEPPAAAPVYAPTPRDRPLRTPHSG